MEKTPALSLRNISKRFGTVLANSHIDLDVYAGEILSILGENGCGKTTLMNMIAGIYFPDEGHIYMDGNEVVIRSPKDAFEHKIGMIHQHFKLVDLFTAAENVVLGVEEKDSYNLKEVDRRVSEIASKYGFNIDPKKKIYDMSVSEKQTVEIIKVLYRGADILILDEPTAVLTPQEIRKLFSVLKRMKEDGKSILIITHKLNEVMEVSDRVAILRKGEHIATVRTSETNETALTEMMVGKKISLNIERTEPVQPVPRLEVIHISSIGEEGMPVLKDITFTANAGEILGIAGIAGSGQKELLEAISGIHPLTEGGIVFHNPKKDQPLTFYHKSIKQIRELANRKALRDPYGADVDLNGKRNIDIVRKVEAGQILFKEDEIVQLRDKSPREIRELGVRLSFVPEDRLGMGLVGSMDMVDNMMLKNYRHSAARFERILHREFSEVERIMTDRLDTFVDRRSPESLAKEIKEELDISTPSVHTPVRRLSGGNVQKVLVGREIAFAPKVLMAAYPVRGLDINSSYVIYNLLNKQKQNGVAVIFVGEDLDVLLELCDRIIVMNGGQITGTVDARTTTKEEIGLLMTKTTVSEEGRA